MDESNSMAARLMNPPAILELDASQGLPPWILLDATVYLAHRSNSTTAKASTSKGHVIEVSVCVAHPPALSYVCIHNPDLAVDGLFEEPRVLRSEKQFFLMHLPLWCPRRKKRVDEFYMYQATPGKTPRLSRIPDRPDPKWLGPDDLGIYCCDDGEYILAGLFYRRGYKLHSYSSVSNVWTVRYAHFELEPQLTEARMPVAAHKVILLGGSLLGWVDLWKGILICDVLSQDRFVQVGYIPLPLTGNICPWAIRDVTCTNGTLKFVEIEHLSVPADVYDDPCFVTPLDYWERGPLKFLAWRATIWNSVLSENCWRMGFQLLGHDIFVEDNTVGVSTVMDHLPCCPTLSIHGDDVVHMGSSMGLDSHRTQMISIDMRNTTLKALVPSPPVYADDKCPYFPCELSTHLSDTPSLPHVIQASNTENVNEDLSQIVSWEKRRKHARP